MGHAVAGFAHGSIGQPDDGEPGQPVRDVGLDSDGSPDRTTQRCGGDRGEHARRTVPPTSSTVRSPSGNRFGYSYLVDTYVSNSLY